MITKKEFLIIDCDDCGEEYSGVPDYGFSVYNSHQEALDAICADDWTVHRDGSVYCSVCSPAHPEPSCIKCGCTGADCSQCVKATGDACHWVGPDKCSRCFDEDGKALESEG